MGQVERYGLYVLVLFIFLILGVAIWGDEPQASTRTPRDGARPLSSETVDPVSDASLMDDLQDASRNRALLGKFDIDEFEDQLVDTAPFGDLGRPEERGQFQGRGQGGAAVSDFGPGDSDSSPDSGSRRGRESAAVAPSLREYTIRSGDTLSEIAKRELGSAVPAEWKRIIALNPDLNPNRLRSGRKIKLPPRKDHVERLRKAGSDLEVGERNYLVKKGDSLSTIASRELGSIRFVKSIMRRNGLADPSKLRIGRELVLPDVRKGAGRD